MGPVPLSVGCLPDDRKRFLVPGARRAAVLSTITPGVLGLHAKRYTYGTTSYRAVRSLPWRRRQRLNSPLGLSGEPWPEPPAQRRAVERVRLSIVATDGGGVRRVAAPALIGHADVGADSYDLFRSPLLRAVGGGVSSRSAPPWAPVCSSPCRGSQQAGIVAETELVLGCLLGARAHRPGVWWVLARRASTGHTSR